MECDKNKPICDRWELQEIRHKIENVAHTVDDVSREVKLVDQRNTEQHHNILETVKDAKRHIASIETQVKIVMAVAIVIPVIINITFKFI